MTATRLCTASTVTVDPPNTLRCSSCGRTVNVMSPKAATWTLRARALFCPRCPSSRRYRTTA